MSFWMSVGFVAMGAFLGWTIAHTAVATECRELGGFYVADDVYSCELVKEEAGQ